jgi:alpha-amylase/alpha-mannosidase (GH57 family)
MNRYVCIHGHFYQPPRENPWLEAIEQQDSAQPYHDWNERITDECYRPNAQARLMDDAGWLQSVQNNYARMSFNFGPTLLDWLTRHAPDVHDAIVAADAESMERFGGHGSAMAQTYNHLIMPLATPRDRRTQVAWGVRDFEHRFGRTPEGIWLSEAAACTDTLEALAEHDIRFTVLAPGQAKHWRAFGEHHWHETRGHGIDPSRPYRQHLPSGKHVDIFFYDGPISQAVAFEHLLNSGDHFASRILDALSAHRDGPQLAHIATDGETYGHHHRFGEMALAHALQLFEQRDVQLTNYAQYLDMHPPEHEVEIHDNSSWSCVHGVERWRADCGCSSGMHPGWNQRWRKPLREALDALSVRLSTLFEREATNLLKSPWGARDAYVDIILDRSESNIDAFLARHGAHMLNARERVAALSLLEMQRHAMLMFTSCGWFFDDLGGIETVQIMRYAARAMQLASSFTHDNLESDFLNTLAEAHANGVPRRNGRDIWEQYVRPSIIDIASVGAHYAVSTLFDGDEEDETVYCYNAKRIAMERYDAGRTRLCIGRAKLRSQITLEQADIGYAVVHLGDHIIHGGAITLTDAESHTLTIHSLTEAFENGDFGAIIRILETDFGTSSYSLSSLFADEQRWVLEQVLATTLQHRQEIYQQLYETQAPLIRYISRLNIPAPHALIMPAEFVINQRLRESLRGDEPDPDALSELIGEAMRQSIRLHRHTLIRDMQDMLARVASAASVAPDADVHLDRLTRLAQVSELLPFEINSASTQNILFEMLQSETSASRESLAKACEAFLVRMH